MNIHIIYDKEDNSSTSFTLKKGWVDSFCDYIRHAAEELNGVLPEIKPIDDFIPNEIKDGDSYVLLVVLSDSNRDSKVLCQKIEKFQNAFGISKQNCIPKPRSKVFKILKSPIKYKNQPLSIRDLDPHEFFFQEKFVSQGSMTGPDINAIPEEYWIQISSLTYSIFEFANGKESDNKGQDRQTVYLANCSWDLFSYRQIIKRELIRDGFRVLPNRMYPDDLGIAKDMISRDINESVLSIHLVGIYCEDNPYQSFSLSDIQYHTAANNKNTDFRKLIWTFPNVDFVDEQQKSFFEIIKRDSENKENSIILQSTLEELKESFKAVVSRSNSAAKPSFNNEAILVAPTPIIYLIYNFNDQKSGQKLAKLFKNKNFEVFTPEFNLDFANDRRIHQEKLNKFDIAIIYCESYSNKWLRMKLMELMKSLGYGRQKPTLVKLLVTKKAFEELDLTEEYVLDIKVIDSLESLAAIEVEDMINRVNKLELLRVP